MIPTVKQLQEKLIPRLKKYAEQNAGTSSTDTSVVNVDLSDYVRKEDLNGYYKFYIGAVQPTDTNVIWLEPLE